MVNLIEAHFFPKWHDVLRAWLMHSPNYQQVEQWYLNWKVCLAFSSFHANLLRPLGWIPALRLTPKKTSKGTLQVYYTLHQSDVIYIMTPQVGFCKGLFKLYQASLRPKPSVGDIHQVNAVADWCLLGNWERGGV